MDRRLQLHEKFLALVPNVYFQQPPSKGMTYPCIVYKRDAESTDHANNSVYRSKKRYQVEVIDRNPDSEIPDAVSKLPYCRFARFFVVDNLNHDVYNLYF
ncbi:tail terminator [Arthrobacter phage ScienceWizSam]|uniref:Tail terminator n=1 Tax=Arthrobacter phage ScienceWizSam TaxID=2927283 RepID=A0A9E7P693_9CAUD|nr:tail terminator [Arthrobacter phage ScienceWizSam]UUG69260.1 tail terminator [Arthrobacter phage ScienceWizSam]